ncbi:MAG: Hsp20/alpha crystallin family protein [Candidatus Thiodiazotropha sp. 6PLUC2]
MFTRLNGFERGMRKDFMFLENEMERLLEAAGIRTLPNQPKSADQPPLNVGVTSEQVDIYLAIAGIDSKALDITLDNNQMSISGSRSEGNSEAASAVKKERFSGEFSYLVNLPDDVDAEKVDADYQHGVLHVSVKRREPAKPRQISVQ